MYSLGGAFGPWTGQRFYVTLRQTAPRQSYLISFCRHDS
jgi:hypothetical protein